MATEKTISCSNVVEVDDAISGDAEKSLDLLATNGHAVTDKFGHPLIQFDAAEEARIRRKIDFCLIPIIAVCYLFCFIDRANIGNARLAGLEKDLKLKGNDYNLVLSAFFIGYIIFELPSSFACKYFGPGWYIPAMTLSFGVMTMLTGVTTNRANISAVRFVLGICEAGMFPGIAYFLSRWYRRNELAFRLSLYIVMSPLAGGFGGLLVSAILKLNNFGRFHSWRMLFMIEGMITCILGVIALFLLTDRPETARWLSSREKAVAVARIKSERAATTEVLDSFNRVKIKRGLLNPVVLSSSIIFGLGQITSQGMAFFMPTIVNSLYPHDTIVNQQLRTVPPYIVGAFFTLMLPYLARRTGKFLIWYILALPFTIIGYAIFLGTTHKQSDVRYGATFLVTVSAYCFGVISSAAISANVISDTSRAAGIGMNSVVGNIGGLASTWSFTKADGPDYPIGNGLNFAAAVTRFCIAVGLLLWMRRDNKRRSAQDLDAALTSLDEKQIQNLDWKNPVFRWRP